jgi:hypothetical protein
VPTEKLQKTEPLYYVYLKDLVTITAADEAQLAGAQARRMDWRKDAQKKVLEMGDRTRNWYFNDLYELE